MTKALENVLACIACSLCALCVLFMSEGHFSKCLALTGQETVDEMLAEISANKKIATLSYDMCVSSLYKSGYEGECKITVFTYEQAVDGTMHQYMISWDEIREELERNKEYVCPENSYVKVSVRARKSDGLSIRSLMRVHEDFTKCTYVSGGFS